MSAKRTQIDERTGEVVQIDAARHLSDNFIRYALAVSRSRAVPDVRDGLKPVQRRILWAGKDVAAGPGFRKCAAIVGEVMGKYHPHGDAAIYDALVRLAQDFSMRLPLIEPQGNFGSANGDEPAAQRYTEAKLAGISLKELLADIDKETVDMRANYDGREFEPSVLPASYPNLLVNGSSGIAVALKTDIPPHNLAEVCDAALVLLEDAEATVDQLMRKLRGPDFPTGGLVLVDENFRAMYATGKGSYTVQAKLEIEQLKNGRPAIVITETLYASPRDAMLEKIAQLVQDQTIEGIVDIRDESARGETRCVIELKKDADADRVLRQLLATRNLGLRARRVFDMTVVAEGGVPRTLGIKQVLQHWLDFRIEVIRRRAKYLLGKLRDREHLLEGLIKALDMIDKIIAAIKKEKTTADAVKALQAKPFSFSQRQAEHIVQMQLGRLAALEQQKVRDEIAEVRKEIKFHEDVLARKEAVKDIIRQDLARVKEQYSDSRRTKIVAGDEAETLMGEELVPDEEAVLTVNRKGFSKRYKAEVLAKRTGERDMGDDVVCVGTVNARAQMYMFTSMGKAYLFKAARFPESRASERGAALEALVQMEKGDSAVSVHATEAKQFVFFTEQGEVKRVDAGDFVNAHAGGIIALTLNKGDKVIGVFPCTDKSDLVVVSRLGQVLRFKASEVRLSGRGSGSVRALVIKKKDDKIVGAGVGGAETYIVTVSDTGFAKRTKLKEIPVQGRSTTGVRAMNFGGRSKGIAAAMTAEEGDFLLLRTRPEGDPRVVPLAKVAAQPRDRAGQRLLPSDCHGGVAWTGQERMRAERDAAGK